MVTHTLCSGFVWARLSLLDKNIGTSATFYVYITEKSHTKTLHTVNHKNMTFNF